MIESLKITTLADNLVMAGGFQGQWGLSFLLELDDENGASRKVMLDTGNDRAPFLHNIEMMEVDLGEVEAVVISHGHGDHTSATVDVVKSSGGVKVYAHPHTFLERFYEGSDGKRTRGGPPKGQGISDIEAAGGEVILSDSPMEVVPGLWTTGQIPRSTSFEVVSPPNGGGKRIIVMDSVEKEDLILDDQALWTDLRGVGPITVTGCAHAGPINTLKHVKSLGNFKQLYGLIGGTHLVGKDDEYLSKTIESLRELDLKLLSPCHCTGFKAAAELWKSFPERFVLNYCGRELKLGEKIEHRVV
ncbi:MAG: MBL fold metallo-hydrolase [Candidatus Bathyarchaeia archaeon]